MLPPTDQRAIKSSNRLVQRTYIVNQSSTSCTVSSFFCVYVGKTAIYENVKRKSNKSMKYPGDRTIGKAVDLVKMKFSEKLFNNKNRNV